MDLIKSIGTDYKHAVLNGEYIETRSVPHQQTLSTVVLSIGLRGCTEFHPNDIREERNQNGGIPAIVMKCGLGLIKVLDKLVQDFECASENDT